MRYFFLSFSLFALMSTINAQNFTLHSNELQGQATARQVFSGFGCEGENTSPDLSWSGAPEGTKSYAITIYDPDAPTGSGWWHWVVFDLPVETTSLASGAGSKEGNLLPTGAIQGITDYGSASYGGPCPPEGHGFHQYIVTVYALKTESLGLDANASPALTGYYLNANALAKASLVFYHQR
ncbi:MAG: YbhB/YbcL family Raf kinase inhibitor-like protein [Bacteroidota bacterium]